ncbi:RsmD family RNA methyltransferase [Aliikangiella sp. IMCC44359]|uniref:RsmD family RNA methyltransferase n=1 Tax=Aliikangiella sp. IMCC44359 TaxID=3459125 RepID=UPI00403AB0C7
MNKIKRAINFLKRHGIVNLSKELSYRLYDKYYENKLAIETQRLVKKSNLDITNEDAVEYSPIGYKAVLSIFKKLPQPIEQNVILDYGSGKGRVISLAAACGFKKVIGIELSKRLSEIAANNILNMNNRKTQDVSILNIDATTYTIPSDVNVIYFFNPFRGETLSKVVSNIKQSYENKPREIYIIFFNNEHFESLIDMSDMNKIYEKNFSQDYNCGLYRINA